MSYNPFGILTGKINGHQVYLRPVSFNSDQYDKNYKTSNGDFIRPTMAVTTCPACSDLIEQLIPESADLSNVLEVSCLKCNPAIIQPFAFRDPIESGALKLFDVNPLALNSLSELFTSEPQVVERKPDFPLIEKRSAGLGQFMRARHQWKKIKGQINQYFNEDEEQLNKQPQGADLFDLMADMMPDTFGEQMPQTPQEHFGD